MIQRKRKDDGKESKRTELIKIKWSTPTTHTHNYGLLKTLELKWIASVRACVRVRKRAARTEYAI